MTTSMLARLDAGDRALFSRWRLGGRRRLPRVAWTALTHLGGTWCSITAAFAPLAAGGALHAAARRAAATLVLSHLIVQCIKRTAVRARPAGAVGCAAHVREPDRFSFPSGHACAALAVALAYALALPGPTFLLIPLALAVGASRVFLGVHYPGDVIIGQLIAVAAATAVAAA